MTKLGFVIKQETHLNGTHPIIRKIIIEYNGRVVYETSERGSLEIEFNIGTIEVILKAIHKEIIGMKT